MFLRMHLSTLRACDRGPIRLFPIEAASAPSHLASFLFVSAGYTMIRRAPYKELSVEELAMLEVPPPS